MSTDSEENFDQAAQRMLQSTAQCAAAFNTLAMGARALANHLAEHIDSLMLRSPGGQAALKDAQEIVKRAASKPTP